MNIRISLKPDHIKNIVVGLIALEVVFVIIYALDFISQHPSWQVCELFDLDREANVPAWFSAMQLLFIGLTAFVIADHSSRTHTPSKAFFNTIAVGFVYLSCDEAAAIHEKITYTFYNNPLVPYFEGVHGVWIVVYGAVGILLAILFHRDLIALWKMFRRETLFLVAGVFTYLIGSAGAETITFFHIDKSIPAVYTLEVVLEEFFEMAGASVILGGMLLLALRKSQQ